MEIDKPKGERLKPTSRLIADLTPEMQAKANDVLEICHKQGVDMLIYCTHRSLEYQAKLYCNGHTREVSGRRAHKLRYVECFPELAAVLEAAIDADRDEDDVAPVTNAAPGESLHAYGMAFDAVPMQNGRCVWDAKSHLWQIYGEAVDDAGLYWAGNWSRFKEYPHAQAIPFTNALNVWSHNEIIAKLRESGALA